jgi:fumarate reductase subunit C
MTINLASMHLPLIVWAVVIIVAIIVALAVIRFFWKHILKYLVQGCAVILVIIALLALLYHFKVF